MGVVNYISELQPVRCKLCLGPAPPLYTFNSASGPFDLLECEECGFHFIDYLDPDQIEVTAPVRDLAHNRVRIAQNAALLRRYGTRKRVLDVGCGAGDFLAELAHPEAKGVEPDRRYRALAIAKGLDVSAEWPAEIFDAVTLWDVIEHVNDPVAVVSEAYARLRPGGVLLLDTPSRDGLLYRIGELAAWMTKGRRGATMAVQYAPDPFCHKQIFRKTDMRRLLERFSNVAISERFELSFPADYYVRYFIKSPALRRLTAPCADAALRLFPVRNKLIVAAVK